MSNYWTDAQVSTLLEIYNEHDKWKIPSLTAALNRKIAYKGFIPKTESQVRLQIDYLIRELGLEDKVKANRLQDYERYSKEPGPKRMTEPPEEVIFYFEPVEY